MSEQPGDAASQGKKRPRKASDFQEDIKNRGAEAVARELALPNLDEILKDLQSKHGVRISLSPQLVKRLEATKASGQAAPSSDPTGGPPPSADVMVACPESDACVFCDSTDRCERCDMMDWCVTHDTH